MGEEQGAGSGGGREGREGKEKWKGRRGEIST